MSTAKIVLFALIASLAFSIQAQETESGTVLLIEKVRTDGYVAAPEHGARMDSVESRFGAPVQKIPAVGDPPITRWIYAEFTVYFEDQTVIHTVVRHNAESHS